MVQRTEALVGNILNDVMRLKPGTTIPKPQATADFLIKRWGGTRRGETALIYTIPNKTDPNRPYEKGIATTEWIQAYKCLAEKGEFTRRWFDQFLPACAKEGACNFTTIGGVFVLLGYANYERGVYRRV
jgi:hypothetical protein